MNCRIQLFARAKDIAGSNSITIELVPGATIGKLRQQLAGSQPALASLLKRCAVAIDGEFVDDDSTVPSGAEIALLPPVSGGQPEP